VTHNAIYSFGDLYNNFARTFERLDWTKLSGDNVLILGLGLGSIPYMLERKFQKRFTYTAVEIDEQVIYFASKYVLDELKSPVTVIQADAVSFIETTEERWDLICLDLFVDDVIPAGAQTIDFMESLKARLNPGGLLLYNSLARTREDKNKSSHLLHEVFLPVFTQGGYLDVGGNWMLVSAKSSFH
jgi:spermidine synthase